MTESSYTVDEPKAIFRWVERDGKHVEQQRWAIKHYDAERMFLGATSEWRDVPPPDEADDD